MVLGPTEVARESVLPDDAVLLRRLGTETTVFDENLDRRRPTSGGFQPHPRSGAISVTAPDLALADEDAVVLLMANDPSHANPNGPSPDAYGIAALTVGDARSVGLRVLDDPQPWNRAHLLLVGSNEKDTKKKGKRLAQLALVEREPRQPHREN